MTAREGIQTCGDFLWGKGRLGHNNFLQYRNRPLSPPAFLETRPCSNLLSLTFKLYVFHLSEVVSGIDLALAEKGNPQSQRQELKGSKSNAAGESPKSIQTPSG